MFGEIQSFPAKLYVGLIVFGGAAILLVSLSQAFWLDDTRWLLLAGLTALVGLFPVYLPRVKGKDRGVVLTVSSIFIFTGILVFGPAVAAILSTVEACVSSWKSRQSMRSSFKVLFNIFHLPVITYAVALLFYAVYAHPSPLIVTQNHNLPLLFLTLCSCAIVYFLLNAGAISLAISLVTGNPFRQTWQQSFLSAALTNCAEASAAVVVFLNFHQASLLAVGIALPTAVVIYYAYKMNLARIHEAQQHIEEVNELYHSTIEALAMAVDAKDQVTHGHIYRVQAMALRLAPHAGLGDPNELAGLRAAALLHDIGKLATPDHILNKPGSLTDSEMETMKGHASVGADILSSVPFPYPVVPIVRHHHEKWDGSGYPVGLKGNEIPLGARILSVVDTYDALRSDRPYRLRLNREAALDYLRSEAGKSYDPHIVHLLVSHADRLENELAVSGPGLARPSPERSRDVSVPRDDKAIFNTVFHDIASAHRDVQAFHEISRTLGRLLNVSETLSVLTDKICGLVPSSACSIYLADSNNQKLVPYHTSGLLADRLQHIEMKIGEGVSGWVAANYRPLSNVSPAPDFADVPQACHQLLSCLAVPLILDQNVVGVITLYSNKTSGFRPNHLRLMENISPHAATAINNAIIYEETKEDAYTDLLTGLPNLRYFNAFVEQELKRAERSNYPVTLMMMDLDAFKRVNDELGHHIGDRVLIEISHVLRNQMRKSDTCIRYGGDEFIAVLPGLDRAEASVIRQKIQGCVEQHVIGLKGESESVRVGISIGSATYPQDAVKLDRLLVEADEAMYADKTSRNPQVQSGQVLAFERRAEAG